MGMVIGPTAWWQSNLVKNSAVGSSLPDGSTIICKNGGTAWIIAPASTQVCSTWANVSIVGCVLGGNLPSISCWAALCNQLIINGFNPSDWFVPSLSQLQNPGAACSGLWNPSACSFYWSSTECTSDNGYCVSFGKGLGGPCSKSSPYQTRAMRCVNY